MKRQFLAIAAAALLTLGTAALPAQTSTSAPCPNCPTGGVPKKDGTGPGYKRGKQQGNQQGNQGAWGRQTGPRDGTGPIHKPSNQGRRGGRR